MTTDPTPTPDTTLRAAIEALDRIVGKINVLRAGRQTHQDVETVRAALAASPAPTDEDDNPLPICPSCEGTGVVDGGDFGLVECHACRGSGNAPTVGPDERPCPSHPDAGPVRWVPVTAPPRFPGDAPGFGSLPACRECAREGYPSEQVEVDNPLRREVRPRRGTGPRLAAAAVERADPTPVDALAQAAYDEGHRDGMAERATPDPDTLARLDETAAGQ